MDKRDLEQLLSDVAGGAVTPADALTRIQTAPTADLGFAQLDLSRGVRQGALARLSTGPVNRRQLAAIIEALRGAGQELHSWSRAMDAEKAARTAELLGNGIDLGYVPDAQLALVGGKPSPTGQRTHRRRLRRHERPARRRRSRVDGRVLWQRGRPPLRRGCRPACTVCLRMPRNLPRHRWSFAIAGMEGALASVIGGLVSCPVIAVPTSVGYGASFGGVAALLAMLNSCASGVSVVNIDNGFGAAYQASLINHLSAGTPCAR